MNASPIAELDLLLGNALSEISAAPNSAVVEQLRIALLGRQGTVTAQLKLIGAQPPELRKEFGAAVNHVRDQLTDALLDRSVEIKE
ncbi:MAG: phenylalanine--tRNA ligase subunit alpha, partial [Proteobacteria bacterium]|nr:phenylalanine--tRNA ligase subunit alpha [Pseudomonadota bacterium]